MSGVPEETKTKVQFSKLIGIEWIDADLERPRAKVEVREELLQPFGTVHGGVMSSVVETICSRATAEAVYDEGMAAMGQSINVSFLRPVSEGSIEVRARIRHRGRSTWVWEAEVRDSADRLCALSQMTIAVRPRPDAR